MKARRSSRIKRRVRDQQRRQLRTEMLESRQLLAADANPFHNDLVPTDINGDNQTTLSDLRLVYSDLMSNGSRALVGAAGDAEGEATDRYVDVNGDGFLTPEDLRRVYARILAGEGESNMQLEIRMSLEDTAGNPLTVATVGQEIILDFDIRDARDASEMMNGEFIWTELLNGGQPSTQFQGVFSAYFDVAHSTNLVNASAPDEFDCNRDLFSGVFLAQCQYDHQDYNTLNVGANDEFPTVTTETNDNGTPGDTSDDFEETIINDLGGVSFTAFQTAFANLFEVHFNVQGSGLTANDDTAQVDEGSSVNIPVLANDEVISELSFERREATGQGSEVAFLRGGATDDLSVITPDEIFGDQSLTLPVSGVSLGGLTVISTTSGTATPNNNNTPDTSDDFIEFTPQAGGPGQVTIVYQISDGIGGTDTANVVVEVGSNNDAPVHATPTLNGNEEQPIAFTGVTVSDSDAGAGALTTTVTATDGVLNATVNSAPASGAQIVINGTVAQINAALATMTYTGNLDVTGQTTVEISTNDNGNTGDGGPQTTTDNITINIANVNDPPIVSVPGAQTVADDEILPLGGLVSVTDVDSPTMQVSLGLTSGTGNAGEIGALQLVSTTGVTIISGSNSSEAMTIQGPLASVQAALATLQYVADDTSGFLGDVTVTVGANDLDGGTDSESFDITVEAGVLPRARRDAFTAQENSILNAFDVLANDLTTDNTSVPTLVSFTQPLNGTVTLDDGGTPGDGTDDRLFYTPDVDYANAGATFDSFTYVMDETPMQGGIPSTGTVNVTVTEQNDAPTAANVTIDLTEDQVLSAADFTNLIRNALPVTPGGGADEAGQTLTLIQTVALNTGATVTPTSLTLNPDYNNDISGPFEFRYVIEDNGTTGGVADPRTATATATINIAAVNDQPIGTADGTFSGDEDMPITMSAAGLLTNDAPGPATATDEAGQTLVFGGLGDTLGSTSTTSIGGGTVTITGDDIVYTPSLDFNGPDSFTYVVNDQQGANNVSEEITVSLSVTAVNDAPIAGDDTNDDAIKGVPLTIPVSALLANDAPGPASATDEAGQTLSITGVTASANATVEVVGDNVIYTANSDFSGQDTFTYTLSDGQAVNSTDTATVTIQVADFIPSSFEGYVYVDTNGSGVKDAVEQVLGGIEITLTGTDIQGAAVTPVTMTTDATGHYAFPNLVPGSYTITQAQPTFFIDGAESTGAGSTSTTNDTFTFTVGAAGGIDSTDNNFGELGLHPVYFNIEELRARLPDDGAMLGINTSGDQLWFSALGNWDLLGPTTTVSATVATDLRTVTISVTDSNGTTQTDSFDTSTDRRVRIMGSDGNGGHVIRVEGDIADLFAAAEAEGEGLGGMDIDQQALEAMARNAVDGNEAVDEVFAHLS